jgi:hypothetical protein
MFDLWAPASEARGWALFAPSCPRSDGCETNSWWYWNHDLSWLEGQIHALGERRRLDPTRFWIVGWSGGASYIGRRTQEFQTVFAALVFHGGGIPPDLPGCASTETPVYFLVGDDNPLHSLAVRLREHYDACAADVTWTLLRHADHDGERRALAAHQREILDWLANKSLVAPSTAPVVASPSARGAGDALAPGPPSDALAPGPPSDAPPAAPSSRLRPAAPSACGCTTVGRASLSARSAHLSLAFAIVALLAAGARRGAKR